MRVLKVITNWNINNKTSKEEFKSYQVGIDNIVKIKEIKPSLFNRNKSWCCKIYYEDNVSIRVFNINKIVYAKH